MSGRERPPRVPAAAWTGLALLLVAAGLLLAAWGLRLWPAGTRQMASPTALPAVPTAPLTATAIAERLIPTPTRTPAPPSATVPVLPPATAEAAGPTPRPRATATARPAPASPTLAGLTSPDPTPTGPTPAKPTAARPMPRPTPDWRRIGVTAPQNDVERYDVERLGAGWYLTGQAEQPAGSAPEGMEFVPLVAVDGATFSPGPERLAGLARARPGALWLVGNEPDVIWQDRATPDEYARVYHDVYAALKAADPACRVAIGGIAQVTPLRLRYLEAVLAAYRERYGEEMPVDVWNIHLAILREERGSWGVDIPPGLPDDRGLLVEIADNADVERLKRQVVVFREWMAERGQRDRPLIVTEFSVLMPAAYGFPPDKVERFMRSAFDWLLAATDGRTGLPADGDRLVQRAAWYSVADRVYATGNLFDPETRRITRLGLALAEYTRGR